MDAAKFQYFSDRYSSLPRDELLELVDRRDSLASEARLALEAVLRTKGIDPALLERFTRTPSETTSALSEKKSVWRRVMYVFFAGWVACLPAGAMSYITMPAAGWYVSLLVLTHAFGGGILSALFGAVTLIARRDRPDGGLRTALIVTVVVAAFITYLQWYGRSTIQ